MIQVIGIPFDENSSYLKGPAGAPERIRQMEKEGSANQFAEDGLEISQGSVYQDAGNVSFTSSEPKTAFQSIRNKIIALTEHTDKFIALGGDHSVTFPIVDALITRYDNLNILHFDAHPDLYNNFEGNRFSHASPFARIMESGKVKSLTQVGIRTLNTHQREQASRFKVNIIEMKDFNLDFMVELNGPLFVSFDMDVLDPAYAPGVSHHEPGGLSTRQAIDIIQRIKVPVVSADIVEYNPLRDINNVTAMVAYKIFKELVATIVRTSRY